MLRPSAVQSTRRSLLLRLEISYRYLFPHRAHRLHFAALPQNRTIHQGQTGGREPMSLLPAYNEPTCATNDAPDARSQLLDEFGVATAAKKDPTIPNGLNGQQNIRL
jgi:hypothetical protein